MKFSFIPRNNPNTIPWNGLAELIVNHFNKRIKNNEENWDAEMRRRIVWSKIENIIDELQFNREEAYGSISVEISHLMDDEFDFLIQDRNSDGFVISTLAVIELRNN